LDAFYEHTAAAVQAEGGRVVKFMGDAALIVFPETAVDRGVKTLMALKDSVDELMAQRGWGCRLIVKAFRAGSRRRFRRCRQQGL
jgi:class 3 adenylate cyclase